jgi:DNA-binding response OmpR family regulator
MAWQGGAYSMASWDDSPQRLRRVAHAAARPGSGYIPLGVALEKMLQISETLDWAARDSHLGVLQIDLAACRVVRGGQLLHLSPSEFAAVRGLARLAGQVVSHAELSQCIWGATAVGKDERVKRLVYRLRRKLEVDPSHPQFIHSYHGQGYLIPADRVRLIERG